MHMQSCAKRQPIRFQTQFFRYSAGLIAGCAAGSTAGSDEYPFFFGVAAKHRPENSWPRLCEQLCDPSVQLAEEPAGEECERGSEGGNFFRAWRGLDGATAPPLNAQLAAQI